MTKEQIEQRVIELVKEYADRDVPVARDTTLAGDLGFDSLDLLDFVMDLEEAFDIAISDDEFDAWSNVGQVIDFIEKNI